MANNPAGPAPPVATLKVVPATAELFAGDAQVFVTDPPAAVVWELKPSLGSVDAHGVYIAPDKVPDARSVVVVAKAPEGAFGTATITLSNVPERIRFLGVFGVIAGSLIALAAVLFWCLLSTQVQRPLRVVVSPPVVTLDPKVKQTMQFTATVLGDPKNSVTWSATVPKSLDATGLYQHAAPEKPLETKTTEVTVKATSILDPNVFETALIRLVPGQSLSVSPPFAAVLSSQQIPFRADGKPVSWSISRNELGAITSDGAYTSPGNIDRTEPIQITAWGGKDVAAAAAVILNAPLVDHKIAGWLTLLFVMVMGALGSMIYYLSSFANYVGNQSFRASWFWFYISRPFVGAALAVIFFFIVGSGLISGTGVGDLMKIAMISALVGLFSEKAVKKLSDVMDVVLAAKDDRKDKVHETTGSTAVGEPKITSTDPASLKKGVAASLKIIGTNFNDPTVKVNEKGPVKPKSSSSDSVTIDLTAEDTAGEKVTITVTNADKKSAKIELKVTA